MQRRWTAALLILPALSDALLRPSPRLAVPHATATAAARLPPPRCADSDYTEAQRLRAEVESPFAQVRLFALPALFAGATIATYFAGTSLLAAAAGLRDASPTAFQDLAIDVGSMAGLAYLWRRELQVREARLKRIAFGSKLAALRVSQLGFADDGTTLQVGQTSSLADLRRGRGQSRRVVLLCAPQEALQSTLETACGSATALADADFLIVPLIASGKPAAPELSAPPIEMLQALGAATAPVAAGATMMSPRVAASKETQPPLPWDPAKPDAKSGWPVAMPQSSGLAWQDVLSSELEQAAKQDPAIMGRGLTIVLKKNGRVGTRRLGMPDWDGLLFDVAERKRSGFDVTNI